MNKNTVYDIVLWWCPVWKKDVVCLENWTWKLTKRDLLRKQEKCSSKVAIKIFAKYEALCEVLRQQRKVIRKGRAYIPGGLNVYLSNSWHWKE